MSEAPAPLSPGSTIGVFGGGQLGRMLSVAAARLGYRCHIYAPDEDSVAAEVSATFTCGDYCRSDLVRRFAEDCDVLTYEFENVPVGALALLADVAPLRPPLAALEVAQDRVAEKNFALRHGARTAPFAIVGHGGEIPAALAEVGLPAIFKTIRFGYDGKGQVRVERDDEIKQAWHSLKRRPAVAEGLVDFEREFSVILVRGIDGDIRFWDSCENAHRDGILARTTVPAHAQILAQESEARGLAGGIAESLDYVGVLTVEFFASPEGPVFNEMAPRVHNSGHWTIEGATTSQFENHIRAICGLPLGDTARAASAVEMRNLIGGQVEDWATILADERAHLHLYGKREARPGRKMGHVTRLDADVTASARPPSTDYVER